MKKKFFKEGEDEELDFEETFPGLNDVYNYILSKIELRKIYLFEPIYSSSILNVIANINILEKKDSKADIELIINCDGGNVQDCLALIDVMDNCQCDIKTVILGRAASAACLIASNGSPGKRFAGKNAEFMFHEAYSTIPEVRRSQMNYWRKEFDRMEKKCNKILSRNTGQSEKIITEMFLSTNMDNWLTAQEAKKFGIIDKILSSRRKIFPEKIEEEDLDG